MKDTVTTAIVRVELHVEVGDGWSPDCSINQCKHQAIESAKNLIRQEISHDGITIKSLDLESVIIKNMKP